MEIRKIINNSTFSDEEYLYVATYEFDKDEEDLIEDAKKWLLSNSIIYDEFDDDYEYGFIVDGIKLIRGRFNGHMCYSINEINHIYNRDIYYQFGEL